jgi:hypothetical protein
MAILLCHKAARSVFPRDSSSGRIAASVVQHTGSACGDADAGLACHACVAVGGETCALFVVRGHVPDTEVGVDT